MSAQFDNALEDVRFLVEALDAMKRCRDCEAPTFQGTGYCESHLGEARRRASAECWDHEGDDMLARYA